MPEIAGAVENILGRVRNPSRYMGAEHNAVSGDWDPDEVNFVLAYPDLYEVGTSHLGLSILYSIINAHPRGRAERTYSPDLDMERELRDAGLPLFSLESRRPVGDFDFIGITLQYELTYTNIVNLLDLSGIPLEASRRRDCDPLVIGGGPCSYNVEPVAPFFDLVLLGDGEEFVGELIDLYGAWKGGGSPVTRGDFLKAAAAIEGCYVPSGYQPIYSDNGDFEGMRVQPGYPPVVKRRIVTDLDAIPVPTSPVVPYAEAVHDRAVVELFRGCTRGCRFCMPGLVYRPVRERSPGVVEGCAREILENTGYEEISLVSLSSSDYSCIDPLSERMARELGEKRTSISLPSLRVDHFSVALAGRVREVRNTGITLAPEAGTQRLRDVINKGVTDEDYTAALETAFGSGCDQLKLYFMMGLPTETDEDILGISRMVGVAREIYKESGVSRRPLKLNLSVACFIPKPQTPFQWEPQLGMEEFSRRVSLLRDNLPRRGVRLSYHDPGSSRMEAIFARGDRRLAPAIVRAHAMGARLEGWTEHFDGSIWERAFEDTGISEEEYLGRRGIDLPLPWDHLDSRVTKEFLSGELARALRGEITPDCRWGPCSSCGVCEGTVRNEVFSADDYS